MSKTEWSSDWSRKITPESGGAGSAESYEGGQVAWCRFGEFSCEIGDSGELLVIFADKGIICGYEDDQELAFVSVELMSLFNELTDEGMNEMARGGEEILALKEELGKEKQFMFLTIIPKTGMITAEVRDDEGVVTNHTVEDINFAKGFGGVIEFESAEVAYHIISRGDELVVSIGEQEGGRMTLIPLSISHEVDYMNEILSGSPRRYANLADKILLNR